MFFPQIYTDEIPQIAQIRESIIEANSISAEICGKFFLFFPQIYTDEIPQIAQIRESIIKANSISAEICGKICENLREIFLFFPQIAQMKYRR